MNVQTQVTTTFVPSPLEEWFGRLGGHVLFRYHAPGATLPRLVAGKLTKVAATGAYARISGVDTEDGKRTLDYPLERCQLLTKGSKGQWS
jgi:hypothetical protein